MRILNHLLRVFFVAFIIGFFGYTQAHAENSLIEVFKKNPEWTGTVDGSYSLFVTFRISGNPEKLESVTYRWERGEKRNGVNFKLDNENVEFMIPPASRERWYKLALTNEETLLGSLTGLSKNGNPFDLYVTLRPASAEEVREATAGERPREGETKLTPDEVRATFIGKPWHSPNGAFLFRKEGTYTYKRFNQSEPRGTWSYRMNADGTLEGGSTSYTFYKNADGYRYFHSRSGQFYLAIPNREPFL